MVELLAPVGTWEKLKTAIYFGANAVYLAGNNFGLRAFAGNFDDAELLSAVEYAHAKNVKVYVTVNIVAFEDDFGLLKDYLLYLYNIKVDAIIVSDLGVLQFAKKIVPGLEVHISTQANITNSLGAELMGELGAKRIVLARELSLDNIKKIRQNLKQEIELECFVHGAMCISYSGRCLLSNYMTQRASNRGECVQACRWEYKMVERTRLGGEPLAITEDKNGTYILNSRDLNMLTYLNELSSAGVASFKIEGRMKSQFYIATTINAYRRAIDKFAKNSNADVSDLNAELCKTANRGYTTGFYFGNNAKESVELDFASPVSTHVFIAEVIECGKDGVWVEQRNRFKVGDKLEVLSPGKNFNKTFVVKKMFDEKGLEVLDAKKVQQKIFISCKLKLDKYDIIRLQLNDGGKD